MKHLITIWCLAIISYFMWRSLDRATRTEAKKFARQHVRFIGSVFFVGIAALVTAFYLSSTKLL